mmetsp:Transcript_73698/g.117263  ORF Transcript_73698/g.117263 Transcript_73698/m.117263 type:complete len:217 (+) Transcript_73698:47-697(+)
MRVMRGCSVVLATTAVASAALDRAGSRMLLNLDLNGDGQVNPQEMDLFARRHGLDRFTSKDFQALDGDGDGALNAFELEKGLRSTVSSREVRDVPSGPNTALAQTDADSSAMSVAETVVKELDMEHAAEEESRRFQRRAAELRANATAFTKVSSQRALRASAAAGESKAKELLDAMVAIEDKAAEAEAQAAALRRRAQAELRQAEEYSSIAKDAMA